MTDAKANRAGRFSLAVLAAIAMGIPGMIAVVASVWSGILWPFVPILFGSWFIAVLAMRSVAVYKINLGASRKQRQIARQEIDRLEARIDEAQRKPRDKN